MYKRNSVAIIIYLNTSSILFPSNKNTMRRRHRMKRKKNYNRYFYFYKKRERIFYEI